MLNWITGLQTETERGRVQARAPVILMPAFSGSTEQWFTVPSLYVCLCLYICITKHVCVCMCVCGRACVCTGFLAVQNSHLKGLGKGEVGNVTEILQARGVCVCVCVQGMDSEHREVERETSDCYNFSTL